VALGEGLYRHRGWVPVVPIVALLVFARPTAAGVAAGAGLWGVGEGIRLWAAAYLGKTARSSRPRAVKLVTGGPYAHTRHPLYWGNFLLTVGFVLLCGAGWPWVPAVVVPAFWGLYGVHARREEAVLARAFPAAHARYRKRVPRWRWRLRPAAVPGAGERGRPGLRRALRVEARTLGAEGWLLIALGLRAALFGSQ